MKNNIQTLEEAIESGLKIRAVYAATGEIVKVIEVAYSTKIEIEWTDGTLDAVDRNDLIDFTWS